MSASTNCWRTEVACRVSQALCRWSGSRGGGLGDLGIVIPLAPGKGAEVIVEAVVLLDDDHYVIDFARPWSTRRLLHRNHVRIGDHSKESILRLLYRHEQTSSNQAGHVT